MAWRFKADWVASPRPPTYQDLNNIALDMGRADVGGSWAGNIDGGGNQLINTGAVILLGQALPTPANGMIALDASYNLNVYYSSAWHTLTPGGISGTTNYVPKFTAAGTIGNSALVDDGTYIYSTTRNFGIGTAVPLYKTHIVSNSNNLLLEGGTSGEGNTPGIIFRTNPNTPVTWGCARILAMDSGVPYGAHLAFFTNLGSDSGLTTGTEKMRLTDNGRFIIGGTAATSVLQVVGLTDYANNAAAVAAASGEEGAALDAMRKSDALAELAGVSLEELARIRRQEDKL
jgi:hypothetical protein